jgi:cobalamin biosynthesis Co2+ chelatase CbiK
MTPEEIKIARLQRKVAKLIAKRDFYQRQYKHYAHVISMQPHLEVRYNRYEDYKKEWARVRDMERRMKEQEILIQLLHGEPLQPYKIDALYSKLIKEEYKKLNTK